MSGWQMTTVKSTREVILEALKEQATLMDICHLKNAALASKFQKNEGPVVLRGDTVKDDSGSYAVFTEQGSSASQMTAGKVMDVLSRPPGCAGQAADAGSAHTQIKTKDAPKLLKFFGCVVHDTSGLNLGQKLKTQWFLLNEICMVTHLLDYCSHWDWDAKKVPNWECLFVYGKQGLFLSVHVDDIKMA